MSCMQAHYPFENKERFEANFPADFVAEGLDQTRGWFYTLMVLSTALFDKPAFKNLVCNGLVLAADGKKMSKRLQNYPDPVEVCECVVLRVCLAARHLRLTDLRCCGCKLLRTDYTHFSCPSADTMRRRPANFT